MGAIDPLPAGDESPASWSGAVASRREFVRGSSLLLIGRFISVILNFGVQVLAVRYLSKGDYGGFAYGIGVASLGSTAVLLGLSRGLPRLVPIYHERKEPAKAFGSIVLAALTVGGLGLALMVGLYLFQGTVGSAARLDAETLSLLLVLIALAPIEAFDQLLQQLVAVYCSPRAIFLRRQVLGPGLKLVAILVVMLAGGNVYMLAYGYLAGAVVGVSAYVVMLVREWRRQDLLRYLRPGMFRMPVREVFGFSVPLISTDLSMVLRLQLVVVMLAYYRDATSVGEFRAVLSVANLNMVVFDAFKFLFVPLASRMFARDDRQGIADLYWVTSLWIALLTFPVFAVTCLLAPSVTVLLFGDRYAQSASILSILAVGYYFNAALGFNASALRVHGKLRQIVMADVLTVLLAVGVALVLIERYGAVGAALSTTVTLVLNNLLVHVGLRIGRTGILMFAWPYVRVYLAIVVVTVALGAGDRLLALPPWVTAALAAAVCLVFVRASRRVLDPKTTFPEVLRIPLVRRLVA